MPIYRALHPQAGVDRLYLKTSECDLGMISIEECVNVEVNMLNEYITGVSGTNVEGCQQGKRLKEAELGKDKTSYLKQHVKRYREKSLHGQFIWNTDQIRDQKSWEWLKGGKLKK